MNNCLWRWRLVIACGFQYSIILFLSCFFFCESPFVLHGWKSEEGLVLLVNLINTLFHWMSDLFHWMLNLPRIKIISFMFTITKYYFFVLYPEGQNSTFNNRGRMLWLTVFTKFIFATWILSLLPLMSTEHNWNRFQFWCLIFVVLTFTHAGSKTALSA